MTCWLLSAVAAWVCLPGSFFQSFQQSIGQLLSATWWHDNSVDDHSFRSVVVDVFLLRHQREAEHTAFQFFDFSDPGNKNILCAECFGQWWLLPHHSLPRNATKLAVLSGSLVFFAILNHLKQEALSFSSLMRNIVSGLGTLSSSDNYEANSALAVVEARAS